MAYSVIDIANKLLLKPMWDDNLEFISNLKLQKLLYYEQGYHLAIFDTPLFDADIEAWMYGPGNVISKDKIKSFFKTQLIDG